MEMTGAQSPAQPTFDPTVEYVGIVTALRGLTVEVQIVKNRPEAKELLALEGHPEVFIEVNFFRGSKAICLNLNNDQVVRCGQKLFRREDRRRPQEPSRYLRHAVHVQKGGGGASHDERCLRRRGCRRGHHHTRARADAPLLDDRPGGPG